MSYRARLRPRLSVLILTLSLAAFTLPAVALEADLERLVAPRWLGPDREPLPFASDEEILEFLRTAPVVAEKKLGDGVNRPLKVTLERDGVRAHAIFRTVDVNSPGNGRLRPDRSRPRDHYIFEVAAYEIARLLELDRVPPVVPRKLDGRSGSLQLWVEAARTEASRIEAEERPQQPASWHLQRQLMGVFDNLISNFDRNHGNMLVGDDGKLWFIDHTRSFQQVPALIAEVTLCERSFYENLKRLDPELVRKRLRPYLEQGEVMALLARRRLLLTRIDELIAERGEDVVLFDLKRS